MKINKKIAALALVGAVSINSVLAQELNFTQTDQKANAYWFRTGEAAGLYGIDVDGAIAKLTGKKAKKVVVALIGQGINTDHNDLKKSVWVNKKEIPGNGIDDDKNGYVDDVNGWNFIGLPDGESCKEQLLEADRIFFRMEKKHLPIVLEEKATGEKKYFRDTVCKRSNVGNKYISLSTMQMLERRTKGYLKELQTKFPDKKDFTYEDFMKHVTPPSLATDSMGAIAYTYVQMSFSLYANSRSSTTFNGIVGKIPDLTFGSEEAYRNARETYVSDRANVGDNLSILTDRFKGNNNVSNNVSSFAAATAGVISNITTVDGECPVEFMGLRVVADNAGEPHDKDLANAIRYAVDHGAEIIDILGGKGMTSNKKWLSDAVAYAKSKGVLILSCSGDVFTNTDQAQLYPVKEYVGGKDITPILKVGATNQEGSPTNFTNFGAKSVDVFAPGADIYSCDKENKYSNFSSSIISSSIVTGIAALIKAYYPNLKGVQIKEIIMKSVDSKKGFDVVLPHDQQMMATEKAIGDFGKMSVSGGVVNVSKAIDMAAQTK